MHNAQNEITGISGATTPTYDANGNLTRDETGRQFVYDAWNRLVEVKDASGNTLKSYAYDGLHRRISETASGTSTDFYYSDAWQVLEERVTSGGTAVPRVQYIWSPVYVDALILRDRDTNGDGTLDERLWVVQDANYNVTTLFDNSGNVVERYVYDPFGQVTVLDAGWNMLAASSFAWVYLHQGGRLDATSGLYHFRYRDYSPTLGRWTSLDPIRYAAGDVNLYRVVFNAPTVFTDPTGESIFGKVFVKIVQITKCGLKVIARNVGFDDAVRAVREGEDVLAPTRKMAHDIAKEAGCGRPPIHDKPHGPRHDGYRPHYHAAGRPKGFGHVFYNIAGALTFSYWAEGQGTVIEWGAAGLDLVNPLSLPKDIMDLGYEITHW